MKQGEEIDDGAKESDDDAKASVETHTSRAADDDEVKVKRIDEESDQASDEENAIPSNNEIGIGFQNLIPPWNFSVERKGFVKSA